MKTMKTRNLFMLFSLSLSGLLLGSCSEDAVTGGDDPTPKPTEVTKFTSGSPSPDHIFGPLRTAMDNGGNHYWTEGDHIWVKSGNLFYKDVDNTILGVQAVADFSIPGTLTANTYEVFYVGQNSPIATNSETGGLSVKIPDVQRQSIPNNAEHFGRSGDCGVATATKVTSVSSSVNNEYSFKLNHRASYLIFAPKDPNIEAAGKCKLKKVKVESDNGINGVFSFNTGHLEHSGGDPLGRITTLEVGEEFDGVKGQDFPIPTTQDVRTNGAFMVIRPGTHALTITYTVEYYGIEQDITKTVASREFLENKYYTIGHTLNVEVPEFVFYFPDTYYMWDAQKWYWYGQETYPTISSTEGSTFPRSQQEDPLRWYNEVLGTEAHKATNSAAKYSAKNMPCYNALTWYVKNGDPHFDSTTEWSLGGVKQRGGLWLKKWSKISGKPAGATITNCSSGSGTTSTTATLGKPSNTADYFFLPALGFYIDGQLRNVGVIYNGYWSSTPTRDDYDGGAFFLYFSSNGDLNVNYNTNRAFGYVAGSRSDGTPWFQ